MNRDQKAAVIDELAGQIRSRRRSSPSTTAGISVPQAADLRTPLTEADASFRVVKNTLTKRAADKAGAEELKALLEGPTAFTFVQRRRRPGRQGDRHLPARERRPRVQGRPAWRRGALDRPDRGDRQPARARRAPRPVRGRARLADHRPGARAERARSPAWRSSSARSPSRALWGDAPAPEPEADAPEPEAEAPEAEAERRSPTRAEDTTAEEPRSEASDDKNRHRSASRGRNYRKRGGLDGHQTESGSTS